MDFEEMQENFDPLTEAVAKYKGQIVLIALLAVAALVYFYVIPHPATLTVRVAELDGGSLNDAEVTVIDETTGKTLATDLTQGGVATFPNMPSRKPLNVEAAKGIAYASGSTSVEIESGKPQSAELQLERRNQLSFGVNEIPSSIPEGCADEFNLEVRNAGSDNFDAELLVEGGLEKILSIPDGRKLVYYNTSTNFLVRAVVESAQAGGESGASTGHIRIKKTKRKLALSIKLNPKIQVDVSPNSFDIRSSKPRQKISLRIFNSGQQPISGISFKLNGDSDLREACNQNLESCIAIEQLGAGPTTELLPQAAMLMSIVVSPPNQPGKTFRGSLEMSAYCLRKSPILVPINIELEGGSP